MKNIISPQAIPALTPTFTRQVFNIVPATPDMRDALCACHRDVRFGTDISLSRDYAIATKDSGYYEAFWQDALTRPDHVTLAAFAAGNVGDAGGNAPLAGFIRMGPADSYPMEAAAGDFGELHQIYIHPDYQGNGLGRSLYQAGIAALAAKGHAGMLINALAENTKAKAFYEHMGAQEIGTVSEDKERNGQHFRLTCAIFRHDF